VIFVTVGTHHHGFARLLRAVEALTVPDLIVQHGHGTAPRNAAVAKPFMRFDEMLAQFERADAVITHAGVGSIILALRHGHVPVVMPRLRRHGEHVDDHQADLTRRLERDGLVTAAWNGPELGDLLARTPARARPSPPQTTGLHRALRSELLYGARGTTRHARRRAPVGRTRA
jgi:UDP-N-acetylglucosamine transferase subunit ALG13